MTRRRIIRKTSFNEGTKKEDVVSLQARKKIRGGKGTALKRRGLTRTRAKGEEHKSK